MKNKRLYWDRFYWNAVARIYERFIKKEVYGVYSKLLTHLDSDVRHTNFLLDVGSGPATLTFYVSSRAVRVIAFDIAPKMIKEAKKNYKCRSLQNVTFKVGSIYNLEYRDKLFDTILSVNVLHLLKRPDLALEEMKRVLTDNGKIILPMNCHGTSFWTRLRSRLLILVGLRIRHRWNAETFKTFVKSQGFTIVKDLLFDDNVPMAYIVVKKKRVIQRKQTTVKRSYALVQ